MCVYICIYIYIYIYIYMYIYIKTTAHLVARAFWHETELLHCQSEYLQPVVQRPSFLSTRFSNTFAASQPVMSFCFVSLKPGYESSKSLCA